MAIKIIHIGEAANIPLTVDSTMVSADSTQVTADQTQIASSGGYTLVVTPRFYATQVKLNLWHELRETEQTIASEATTVGGYLHVPFDIVLEEGDSFEATLRDTSDRLMWRGKIYATDQTDIENFTLIPPSANGKIRL